MNDATLITLGGAAGAVVTAVFAGIVLVINAWHKNAQEKRNTEFTEQGVIIDRQEKQIARLERQILDQQKAITAIQDQHTDCREESVKLRAVLSIMHAALQKAGIEVVLPPELDAAIARQAVSELAGSEFMARETAQNTNLLASVDKQIQSGEAGNEGAHRR